ncbi:hypothetical protein [Streptomyces sp. NPDC001250]|uniref:hypothetical protein n=1 Tax=unclassified Streptomyces TaxID=2593676 RepID=UPI0033200F2E
MAKPTDVSAMTMYEVLHPPRAIPVCVTDQHATPGWHQDGSRAASAAARLRLSPWIYRLQ